MNNNLAGDYWLANDIDASATVGWNGGAGFEPVGSGIAGGLEATKFRGEFDGKRYTINGLFINRPGSDEIGLFGWTYDAIIKNGELTNVDITGKNWVGALVGYAESGVGQEIDNCSSTGNVNGDDDVGGLFGGISEGTLVDSHSSVTVIGVDDECGGLIGYSYAAEIDQCYANGNVTAGDDYVGGFIGASYSDTISQCYARGNVTGDRWVGGLIGYINNSTLDDCFSTGIPTGNVDVGGLIGENTASTINDCFWDTETSGTVLSDGGTGKTTAQMKTKSTFTDADWDFIIIWGINGITNDGYPFFWTMPPEPIVSPRETVDIEDKITLECVRNVEMAAGGRFRIDKEGKAVYRSRYARNA